jgi:hypothetical protein
MSTSTTGTQRVVFIDRMEILPNGKLVVHGPATHHAREADRGRSACDRIQNGLAVTLKMTDR